VANFRNKSVMLISGAGVAVVAGGAALMALAFDGGSKDAADEIVDVIPQPQEIVQNETTEPPAADKPLVRVNEVRQDEGQSADSAGGAVSLEFSRGGVQDLQDARLTALAEKLASVPGVPEQTKVWIATADVASAPGVETIYHVKGPLTCGSHGCELVVVSEAQNILLETAGDSIEAPEMDTLVVNPGSGSETIWTFNGDTFEKE